MGLAHHVPARRAGYESRYARFHSTRSSLIQEHWKGREMKILGLVLVMTICAGCRTVARETAPKPPRLVLMLDREAPGNYEALYDKFRRALPFLEISQTASLPTVTVPVGSIQMGASGGVYPLLAHDCWRDLRRAQFSHYCFCLDIYAVETNSSRIRLRCENPDRPRAQRIAKWVEETLTHDVPLMEPE
jgi:hypothetical protein